MKKRQHWFELNVSYQLLTYNLYSDDRVVYDRRRSVSRQGFTFKLIYPSLTGAKFQVTKRGKLGIYTPENLEIDDVVMTLKPVLDEAAGEPVRLTPIPVPKHAQSLRRSHPAWGLKFGVTQAPYDNPELQLQLPNVGFIVVNLNDRPVRAKFETAVILGGRNLGFVQDDKGYFCGDSIWNLNPGDIVSNVTIHVPEECAESDEDLTIEVRSTIFDQCDAYDLLPKSWTYVRNRNYWFYEPKTFTDETDYKKKSTRS